jgi:mannosyltransferase OCH1-like enzyme
MDRIPHIIHQVWEGRTEPMPFRLKILANSWKEKNPALEYRLWSNDEMIDLVETHFPDFIDTYNDFEFNVQRWDAIRYMILYKYGGVYADLDTECLKPIDKLFADQICCFGEEPVENCKLFNLSRLVGNAIMAAIPGQSVFLRILDEIKQCLHNYDSHIVLHTTGPLMITRIVDALSDNDNVQILPYEYVAPLRKRDTAVLLTQGADSVIKDKLSKAYCVHYFFGSWEDNFSFY